MSSNASLWWLFGIGLMSLGAIACSDNEEAIVFPKPEGPPVGQWNNQANYPYPAVAGAMVLAGDEYISWGGTASNIMCNPAPCISGRALNLKTQKWRELKYALNIGHHNHPWSVWTGTEVVFWGGSSDSSLTKCLSDGVIYNPTTDSWRLMSLDGAIVSRVGVIPLWTGKEMIFWGGKACGGEEGEREVYGDGAAYNPETDSWRKLSTVGAPSRRLGHVFEWTGKEIIVWGGTASGKFYCLGCEQLNDGYAYNPETDSWRKLSKKNAPTRGSDGTSSVWTGKEVLIWDLGKNGDVMAAYNPKTDSWRALNPAGPHGLGYTCNAWTGKYWVICGSDWKPEEGALYDPELDVWHPIPPSPMGETSNQRGFGYEGDMIVAGGTGAGFLSDTMVFRFLPPK